MRVLSLHNFAKFGCFTSMGATKLLTIYLDGAISAKFSTPPSGKTMDGSQKSFRPKMMARTTSITMQNFVEITDARRRERTKCDVFNFVCLLPAGSARRAALPVFRLLTGRFWGFSPRRGDTLHRLRSNLAGRRSAPPCQIWPWSVQGWGFTAPKTEKNRILPI